MRMFDYDEHLRLKRLAFHRRVMQVLLKTESLARAVAASEDTLHQAASPLWHRHRREGSWARSSTASFPRQRLYISRSGSDRSYVQCQNCVRLSKLRVCRFHRVSPSGRLSGITKCARAFR